MQIIILDCQNTLRNYAFIIIDTPTKECILIDSLNSPILYDYLEDNELHLKSIVCTHHHNDHVGGNLYLQKKYHCRIYGNDADKHRIAGITNPVIAGDVISLFDNRLQFKTFALDGHTIGHIGLYAQKQQWLFVGDTLFNMGCGRRFEGSSVQYYQSLQTLMNLSDDTMVYATHEYTVDNIKFAKHIIPNEYDLTQEFLEYCEMQIQKRNDNIPTIPFDLGSQKKFNPFLLSHLPIIKQSLNMDNHSNSDVFGFMRSLKDNF